MSEPFAGRVAIVTGAARGIGRAIALRLARRGADVAIADINLAGAKDYNEALGGESVESEIRALGRRAIGVEGDLGNSQAAEKLVQTAWDTLGRIDILVNCAGGAVTPHTSSRASVCPEDEAAKTFAANYFSMVNCCRAAVPHMRKTGGAIINIASVAGFMPPPDGSIAHYGAAKAALMNFTRSLAGEVGPDSIRVNAIAPGIIMTARIAALASARGVGTPDQAAMTPLRRLGEPEDIAKVVEFFASDLAGFVTGQCIAVNGGMPMIAC